MAADDDGTGQPSQYIIDSCNHILSANDNSTGNKATDDGSGNKSTDNYVLYLNCINDLAEAE